MSKTELRIIPECYVDTKVAEMAGNGYESYDRYNHQHGCGDVARELIKRSSISCLGIVDEDKNKGPRPKYFLEFTTVKDQNHLLLKKHKERKQYLILIEKWLLKDAVTVQINPTDQEYQLPADLKGLITLSKTRDIINNKRFRAFVAHLLEKNAPSIMTLRNWIELFKQGQLDSVFSG